MNFTQLSQMDTAAGVIVLRMPDTSTKQDAHPLIRGFFNHDEFAFLERMFAVEAGLAERFERYLALPDKLAIHMAVMEDLPKVLRAGWVKRGVPDPENVTEHSTKLIRLCMLLKGPEGVDMGKLPRMALVHDMPEVIATDFTPQDGITSADKHRLESLAARVIFRHSPDTLALAEEYIAQETVTSHWLNDLDKMEAVMQALHYEAIYPEFEGKLYREFADYTQPRLKTEQGQEWFDCIAQGQDSMRTKWQARHRDEQQRAGSEIARP